jgi:prepilin-type N-terminal cleavage/methylation domain-containing protein/prepilin-type processing-associated H-X9-DG protein
MVRRSSHVGFTLVELLVTISIVALLLGILLPVVSRARATAMRTLCMSHQRQLGTAIHTYAGEYDGRIPYGPIAPPVVITNFYLYTGQVTNLVSLTNGEPVGLGLLLDPYLARQPQIIFCPDNDQPLRTDQEIAAVGRRQVQSSYFYRHGSVVEFAYPPDTSHTRLAGLGSNRRGQPIRALAMDGNLLAPEPFHAYGIYTRTSHQRRIVNVLYADGSVRTLDNTDDRFTIDLESGAHQAPSRILEALEVADAR